MTSSLQDLLRSLRAAAEPTRLRLLAICSHGELSVGEITRIVGQSQPRVSRHLKLLCDAGLLYRFREQNWVFYRVPAKGEGAEFARALLSLIDSDDAKIQLDKQRVEEIQEERAELASDFLGNLDPSGVPGAEEVFEQHVNEAVRTELAHRPIGDLLDIGTGTGRMLRLLGDRAEQAVGVDISSGMLMVARTNLHAAGLDQCMVRPGDMYNLPYPNQSFDTVTMDQVLVEASEPVAALREAARTLRPGGQLLLVEMAAGVDPGGMQAWLGEAGLSSEGVHLLPAEYPAVIVCLARRRKGRAEGGVAA